MLLTHSVHDKVTACTIKTGLKIIQDSCKIESDYLLSIVNMSGSNGADPLFPLKGKIFFSQTEGTPHERQA